MDAEQRILAKAEEKHKANLELAEVQFWMRKWGLIVQMYPHIAKALMIVPLQGEFNLLTEEVEALKSENRTLRAELEKANERITKGAKMVSGLKTLIETIDKRTTQKPQQQGRR